MCCETKTKKILQNEWKCFYSFFKYIFLNCNCAKSPSFKVCGKLGRMKNYFPVVTKLAFYFHKEWQILFLYTSNNCVSKDWQNSVSETFIKKKWCNHLALMLELSTVQLSYIHGGIMLLYCETSSATKPTHSNLWKEFLVLYLFLYVINKPSYKNAKFVAIKTEKQVKKL